MSILTTFPCCEEFEKAARVANERKLPYTVLSPAPGYARVGAPAMIIQEEDRSRFIEGDMAGFVTSGWVDYHASSLSVPSSKPPDFPEDKFGIASIMVLQPCMADHRKLRAIAHISGDLTEVFPYMNATEKLAFYNAQAQSFTLMDAYRFIALYPRRIAMAKTDDIVDTWRVLETLRLRLNECWRTRANIIPSTEYRRRPPALEIYSRLPKTNCGECGERTCMAFALSLWSGTAAVRKCAPVFGGTHGHLKDALVEICGGLRIDKSDNLQGDRV
jgi:ArsR family metal-binding transcriptional regulator